MDCLFCKIIKKEISSTFVYEDTRIVAFTDIHPQAPIHHLIVPRKHIATLNEATADDNSLLGDMLFVARELAQEAEISDSGYRLVFNTNRGAGQSVFHIHLHLLGGRAMHWPPG